MTSARSTSLTSLAVMVLLLGSGCSEDGYLLRFSFSGTDPADVAHIEVHLLDSCPVDPNDPFTGIAQASVYLTPDQDPLPLMPAVATGTYALYARATDASCALLATGCRTIHVEGASGAVLSLQLEAAPYAPCPWGANCSPAGYCYQSSTIPPIPDSCVSPPNPPPDAIRQLIAGPTHTCAVTDADYAFCWGDNTYDQLGSGRAAFEPVPVVFNDATDAPMLVQELRLALNTTCILHATQELECLGQYGVDMWSPTTVVDAAVTSSHGCAIVNGTNLRCWGTNASGELGLGDFTPRPTAPTTLSPALGWTTVGVGTDGSTSHTCAIAPPHLYCAGDAAGGSTPTFTHVSTGWSAGAAVHAGGRHTCIVDAGRVYCWGSNDLGQLGVAGAFSSQPIQVDAGAGWTAVATGRTHTCAIHDGDLYCWGGNDFGQAGPFANPVRFPQLVDASAPWTSLTAGDYHTCGVRSGSLLCWGFNGRGQLGFSAQLPTDSTPYPDEVCF